ncbi:tetratricopeptide repeat protein [Rubrivirga sp.]|uniref:tetratricopeptide repeat protein n=1 Tax=Rubrivirga sp. TaxID=1885344 RepID=UPI003C777A23
MIRSGLLLVLVAVPVWGQAHVEDGTVEGLTATAQRSLQLSDTRAAERYVQAYSDALDFRLEDALDGFNEVGRLDPASPASAYGLETVTLWRAFLTEEDEVFDRFYELNDSLQTAADRQGAELLGATAKLHRALAFGRQERYTRAGNSFREACGRFREISDTGALYGRGVCEVAGGSVPRSYRWLARLLGFRGSVAGGLASLEVASLEDGLLRDDALIAFAIADATLNERRAGSVDRLVALSESRPSSPLLAYLAGYHLLLDRRASEAEVALRRGAESVRAPDVEAVPFLDAHLGLALYRQHKFEEALPLLERYARTFHGRALLAQTTLRAGLSHEMLGDRRRAEGFYRRVRASRDYDTDLSAAREAERRLEAPMTSAERALLLGEAAFDGGSDLEAVRLLQPVVTDSELPAVVRAEAAYRTGRAYQSLERWADAQRHFQLAIDRPGDPLAKWGPWSIYHSGEIEEATGDLDAARQLYERVLEDETEFDYHKALEQRARTALERIGR